MVMTCMTSHRTGLVLSTSTGRTKNKPKYDKLALLKPILRLSVSIDVCNHQVFETWYSIAERHFTSWVGCHWDANRYQGDVACLDFGVVRVMPRTMPIIRGLINSSACSSFPLHPLLRPLRLSPRRLAPLFIYTLIIQDHLNMFAQVYIFALLAVFAQC